MTEYLGKLVYKIFRNDFHIHMFKNLRKEKNQQVEKKK